MSIVSQSLLRSQYAPFQQSHAFAATLTHLGRPPIRLALRRDQGEVQVIRRGFGPIRAGLISRADVPRAELSWLARETECNVLLLNPETATGAHGLKVRSGASVAELSLRDDLPSLRAGLKQKWRNRLNKAEDQGLKIAEIGLHPHQGHWLIDAEVHQSRQRRYSNWPAAFTLAFAKANKAQARVFEARQCGDVVGAMLFLCHGSVASYHIGWANDQGRRVCAHNALMWRAMERLKARGGAPA